jgi:membrane-associated phospholipid phosphatase
MYSFFLNKMSSENIIIMDSFFLIICLAMLVAYCRLVDGQHSNDVECPGA